MNFLFRVLGACDSGDDNDSVFSGKEQFILIPDFTSYNLLCQRSRVRYPTLADIAIFITGNFNIPVFILVFVKQGYNTPYLHTDRSTRYAYNMNCLQEFFDLGYSMCPLVHVALVLLVGEIIMPYG